MTASRPEKKECDVLILGASLAGSCLARQLRLQLPDLRIIVIDKKRPQDFRYWVGEATVPLWVDYAVRNCQLGPYLWKNHIVKHGVRFFFDSAAKDLPLCQMSEFGRREYPVIASFHLDRATFDLDLVRMNRELGIEVLLGVGTVGRTRRAIELSGQNGQTGHVVATTAGPISCRWLVDATGMSALLARKLGLLCEDWKRVRTACYWSRFSGVGNIDQLGDDAWRRRVGYTERNLSANHYMYRGYWIWQIPITDKLTSIGVTVDEELFPLTLKNAGELHRFLLQHRCLRDLLGDSAKAIDFHGLTNLARHSSAFCSIDRWFITGMASSFVDPLFSSNSMTIAAQNILIGRLIEADREGNAAIFRSRVAHFNSFFTAFHEANLRALDYRAHGSFDAWAPFRMAMLNNIITRAAPEYYRGLQTLVELADRRVDQPVLTAEALGQLIENGFSGAIRRMKNEYTDFLDQHAQYYGLNAAQFLEGTERLSARRHLWDEPTEAVLRQRSAEDLLSYEALVRHYVSQMAALTGVPWSEAAFDRSFERRYASTQRLADLVDALRAAAVSKGADAPNTDDADHSAGANLWSPTGPPCPDTVGWVRG